MAKFLNKKFLPGAIALLLVCGFFVFGTNKASAAPTPHSIDVTGVSLNSVSMTNPNKITVGPGATISAQVWVSTVNRDWKSTSWRLGSGDYICYEHDDHLGTGSYTETFNITAPVNIGTYDVNFKVYDLDNCNTHGNDDSFHYDNGVEVKKGTIHVIKVTIPEGDQTAFSITAASDGGTVTLPANRNTLSTNHTEDFTVTPGYNYAVTEDAKDGWAVTGNNCTNLSPTAGQTVNCTITNTRLGSIIIHKDIVAPDGQTPVEDGHKFIVRLDSESSVEVNGGGSNSFSNLLPGDYTISEDADENYEFVSFSLPDSDTETDGYQVAVTAGQNTELTIKNKQKTGHLTIVKNVINHEGIGTADANDFEFSLNSVETWTHFDAADGAMTGQNIVDVNPGYYTVTERGPQGYAASYSNCEGTLTSNGSATCTITNNDIPAGKGAITVIKSLPNDNGGTAAATDFPLWIEGESLERGSMDADSGKAYTLDYDYYYTVGETGGPNGYTQTSIECTSGDASNSGTFLLNEQQAWVCTITNDDIAPSLTLRKQVNNGDGIGSATPSDFVLTADGGEAGTLTGNDTGNGVVSGPTFKAGTYTLSETGPAGYSTGNGWSCEGAGVENNQIHLSINQTAVCTITNTAQPGTLHVIKHVINDNDGTKTASDFYFKLIKGESVGEPQTFIQDEGNRLLGQNNLTLNPGTYSITEPAVDGYKTSYDGCSDIVIANGGEYTCTITNDDIAPAPETPSGGGGGSGAGPFIQSPCVSVEYYDWQQTCVNGVQFRDVKTLIPEGCQMTQAQRDAAQRTCGVAGVQTEGGGQTPPPTQGGGQENLGGQNPPTGQGGQVLGVKLWPDGSLIRWKGDMKVWFIIKGKRFHVVNWRELWDHYRRWKINNVSQAEVEQYQILPKLQT